MPGLHYSIEYCVLQHVLPKYRDLNSESLFGHDESETVNRTFRLFTVLKEFQSPLAIYYNLWLVGHTEIANPVFCTKGESSVHAHIQYLSWFHWDNEKNLVNHVKMPSSHTNDHNSNTPCTFRSCISVQHHCLMLATARLSKLTLRYQKFQC